MTVSSIAVIVYAFASCRYSIGLATLPKRLWMKALKSYLQKAAVVREFGMGTRLLPLVKVAWVWPIGMPTTYLYIALTIWIHVLSTCVAFAFRLVLSLRDMNHLTMTCKFPVPGQTNHAHADFGADGNWKAPSCRNPAGFPGPAYIPNPKASQLPGLSSQNLSSHIVILGLQFPIHAHIY